MEELIERLKNIERLLMISMKNVYDVKEMALILGITPRHVRLLASQQKLPHYRDGDHKGSAIYFKKEDVEKHLTRYKIPSADEIEREAANYCATHNKKTI